MCKSCSVSIEYTTMKTIAAGFVLFILATLATAEPGVKNYNPATSVAFHLFTRQNRLASQVLTPQTLPTSNFDSARPTKLLIHGFRGGPVSAANVALINGFLDEYDVNVVSVDWSAGANSFYTIAMVNVPATGRYIASVINIMESDFGLNLDECQIVGFNLGGHLAGVVGLNLNTKVAYLTALDPSFHGWSHNSNRLTTEAARYVEVLHTNAGENGFDLPLGHVDFYANGGQVQAGCWDSECSHNRAYEYYVESLSSLTFLGVRCESYDEAIGATCTGTDDLLHFGGTDPKTGSSGIYFFRTNTSPPYAQS